MLRKVVNYVRKNNVEGNLIAAMSLPVVVAGVMEQRIREHEKTYNDLIYELLEPTEEQIKEDWLRNIDFLKHNRDFAAHLSHIIAAAPQTPNTAKGGVEDAEGKAAA